MPNILRRVTEINWVPPFRHELAVLTSSVETCNILLRHYNPRRRDHNFVSNHREPTCPLTWRHIAETGLLSCTALKNVLFTTVVTKAQILEPIGPIGPHKSKTYFHTLLYYSFAYYRPIYAQVCQMVHFVDIL